MKLTKIYATVNKKTIDLTLSVNPLGCSPRVLSALKQLTKEDISKYPDTDTLTNTIAATFGVPKTSIVLGNGSEQLIKLLSQTFLEKRDVALVQVGSFPLFTKEPQIVGATVVFFDPKNPPVTASPRLIFLSNPATPTGEVFDKQTLMKLAQTFPDALLVIDEANGEFTDVSFIPDSSQFPNVIILRTFSKVLGLAGLRIGCAIGPTTTIKKLSEVQQAFPVSSIACTLATCALKDQQFIDETKTFVAKERTILSRALTNRGFRISQSVTNNLFVSRPDAKNIIQQLNNRGVSVIDGSFFPGLTTPGFRISIKDKKTNRIFLQKLDDILACINKDKLVLSKEVV